MNETQQSAGSRMARFQPALLGGLFIGVIATLPVVGDFNACCCLWVVVGGVMTTYLNQQSLALPIETSDAALSGLIAGAVGAVITSVLSPIVMALMGLDEAQRQALDQIFGQMGDVPPEMVAWVERLTTGPLAALFGFLMRLPAYSVAGMLGALLGTAFFRKKPVAQ